MSTTFTHAGTLPFGVLHNDVIHRDFEIRLQTVGDEIDVGDDIGSDIIDVNFTVHLMARTLLRLGTIPKEAITPQLLRDALVYEDYNALIVAAAMAKKKLRPEKPAEETSASAAPSSESTDSDSPISGA